MNAAPRIAPRIAPAETRCTALNRARQRSARGTRRGERCRRMGRHLVGGQRLCTWHADRLAVSRNGQRALTWDQVTAIRTEVAAARRALGLAPGQLYHPYAWERDEYGVRSYTEIARAYGVSSAVISLLVAGQTYQTPHQVRGSRAARAREVAVG